MGQEKQVSCQTQRQSRWWSGTSSHRDLLLDLGPGVRELGRVSEE